MFPTVAAYAVNGWRGSRPCRDSSVLPRGETHGRHHQSQVRTTVAVRDIGAVKRNTAHSRVKPHYPSRRMRTGTLHESYGNTTFGNPATQSKSRDSTFKSVLVLWVQGTNGRSGSDFGGL